MKTILIVDDSPTIIMSMEGILSKAGYGVAKAASGEAALGMLNAGGSFNMMITDLNMGKMNGIELIAAARKLPSYRFMPILMLTTESQQSRRQEAKIAGASGWLVKPADTTALLGVLKQLLPGGAA